LIFTSQIFRLVSLVVVSATADLNVKLAGLVSKARVRRGYSMVASKVLLQWSREFCVCANFPETLTRAIESRLDAATMISRSRRKISSQIERLLASKDVSEMNKVVAKMHDFYGGILPSVKHVVKLHVAIATKDEVLVIHKMFAALDNSVGRSFSAMKMSKWIPSEKFDQLLSTVMKSIDFLLTMMVHLETKVALDLMYAARSDIVTNLSKISEIEQTLHLFTVIYTGEFREFATTQWFLFGKCAGIYDSPQVVK